MPGFGLEEQLWGGGGFEGVAEPGETQEPEGVGGIGMAVDVEGGPAGVREPMVLLGEVRFEEGVVDGAGEGNVERAPGMDVADLGLAEAEFAAGEAMRAHGDTRPGEELLFEILERRSQWEAPAGFFWMARWGWGIRIAASAALVGWDGVPVVEAPIIRSNRWHEGVGAIPGLKGERWGAPRAEHGVKFHCSLMPAKVDNVLN